MDRIITTRPIVGIAYMQVCCEKDATDEEILEWCNTDNPSGTTHGWTVVHRNGDMAPVKCNDDPNRLHIMVNC